MEYGDVPMAPLLRLDDTNNGVKQLNQARWVNEKINYLMKQRGQCLNKDKSVCIIMGSKKQKKGVTLELENHPLVCGQDKFCPQLVQLTQYYKQEKEKIVEPVQKQL